MSAFKPYPMHFQVNMTCEGCARVVSETIRTVIGEQDEVTVDLPHQRVAVTAPKELKVRILAALVNAGYPANTAGTTPQALILRKENAHSTVFGIPSLRSHECMIEILNSVLSIVPDMPEIDEFTFCEEDKSIAVVFDKRLQNRAKKEYIEKKLIGAITTTGHCVSKDSTVIHPPGRKVRIIPNA